MIIPETIKKIIEVKLGVDIESIGKKGVESVIGRCIKKFSIQSLEELGIALQTDEKIFEYFTDEIIIPKTWFFRNGDSFLYLKKYLEKGWLNKKKKLNILSFPCSTGEEAYSISATAFEAGLRAEQFHIDALDIAKAAIETAEIGEYDKKYVKVEEIFNYRTYFLDMDNKLIMSDVLKAQISFMRANLLEMPNKLQKKYDIIYCRNVLIYFNETTRKKVILNLTDKLKEDGILFTGHAELNMFLKNGFIKKGDINSFSCKVGVNELPDSKPLRKKVKSFEHKKRKDKIKRIPIKQDIKNEKAKIEKKKSDKEAIRYFADIGEYSKAMELCDEYINEKKPSAEIYFIKGLIMQIQKNDKNAKENFEKAIYLKPDYYDALLQMSILLENQGEFKRARLFKNRAMKSFED